MNIATNQIKNNTAATSEEKEIAAAEQHSLLRTILLHLVPGAIIYLIFVLTAPLFEHWGYPGLMGLLLGATLVLFPTLAELYRLGKKRNGKLSLQGIMLYRQPMPWWQYAGFTLLALLYALVVTIVIFNPFIQPAITNWFSWWPAYEARTVLGHYASGHLLITEIFYVILNTLYPIIEEIYFRGYLMPRISRFGKWTPWISITLFSLYHLWQPWNNLLNVASLWPLSFLSWKKRNVYLAISIHCTLNIIGMLPLLITLVMK
ncbi:hypothetical protein KDA_65200 [Dictyobacter alpinus]|uniref:CAAX prenyl protease 2/Lysostaphin resistance protein A-like domain-containing protein n=1 Tax=Dictyobacter alpinus TaxID=2014873 RepID=A0A402BI90_9CHLR|nr:CPBP family intramembrane glutamic endopeptidase [Dictyobacter alpinus]GCE31036.1 hypothetical protein KDA_65200 [Dictyobacter alpinus]